jgi:hypothetical protein
MKCSKRTFAPPVCIAVMIALAAALLVLGCDDSENGNPINSFALHPAPSTGIWIVDEFCNLTGAIGSPTGAPPGYPNPFTGSTRIIFAVPTNTTVSLWVTSVPSSNDELNALTSYLGTGLVRPPGKPITYLLRDQMVMAGAHEVLWSPGSLPSGVYRIYLHLHGNLTWGDMLYLNSQDWTVGDPWPL